MQTAEERYNFAEVEDKGNHFLTAMLQQCKVHEVANITPEIMMAKLGTKETMSKYFLARRRSVNRETAQACDPSARQDIVISGGYYQAAE